MQLTWLACPYVTSVWGIYIPVFTFGGWFSHLYLQFSNSWKYLDDIVTECNMYTDIQELQSHPGDGVSDGSDGHLKKQNIPFF